MRFAALSGSVRLLVACECDARGRAGLESQPYPQREYRAARTASAAAAVALSEDERREPQGSVLRGADSGEATCGRDSSERDLLSRRAAEANGHQCDVTLEGCNAGSESTTK